MFSRSLVSEVICLRAHIQEVLAKLNEVTLQLSDVMRERAREVSILQADLESEKEARRRWQDKAGTLRERLSEMVVSSIIEQSSFIADFASRSRHGLCLC